MAGSTLGTFLALWLQVAPGPEVSWHPDLVTAEAAAAESGRAMLVVFR